MIFENPSVPCEHTFHDRSVIKVANSGFIVRHQIQIFDRIPQRKNCLRTDLRRQARGIVLIKVDQQFQLDRQFGIVGFQECDLFVEIIQSRRQASHLSVREETSAMFDETVEIKTFFSSAIHVGGKGRVLFHADYVDSDCFGIDWIGLKGPAGFIPRSVYNFLEVEQIPQKTLFLIPVAAVTIPRTTAIIIIIWSVITLLGRYPRRWIDRRGHRRRGNGLIGRSPRTLNNFVQFPAVQPDPPALRAEVDFDSLTIGHGEGYIAFWAVHNI